MLDGHIHISSTDQPSPETLTASMRQVGMDGGLLLSLPPASFPFMPSPRDTAFRLKNLLDWCGGKPNLFPAYWIDPTEDDAEHQVEQARQAGVAAFKVICNHFYPSDARAMRTFSLIAQTGKPILFHSGILWDGQPSSRYNRPVEFEAMLDVKGLRFALAHISWPWCDECLAVYTKMLNACQYRKQPMSMYIDTTPGTPPLHRKDALTKIYTMGFDMRQNVFFGADTSAHEYGFNWVREWLERDKAIMKDLARPQEDLDSMFEGNFRRFLTGN